MVISDHLEQNSFSYIKFITLGKLNLYTACHRSISGCIKWGYSKGIYQPILQFWFHQLEQTMYSGKLEAELHTACAEEKRLHTDTKTTWTFCWGRTFFSIRTFCGCPADIFTSDPSDLFWPLNRTILHHKWSFTVPFCIPSFFAVISIIYKATKTFRL